MPAPTGPVSHADPSRLSFLTEALQGNNPTAAKQAIAACRKIAGDQVLLVLMYKGLAHPDSEVQQQTAAVLAERVDEISDQLRTLLNHPHDTIRHWSLHLLGHAGRLTLDELAAVLARPERDETKILAADLIAGLDQQGTIQRLIVHLGDPSWMLRRHINKLLYARGEAVLPAIRAVFAKGNLHQKYWALKLLVDVAGEKALKQIRKFLISGDFSVRLYAIAALEFVPGREALSFLFTAMLDNSPIIRYQAARVLASKGEEVLKEAIQLMRIEGPELKDELICIIGRILGPKCRQFFRTMLESPNPDDRYYALKALGQAPDSEGVKHLIRAFKDPVWVVRSQACDLLSRLGPMATDDLINALSDPDFDTLSWACKALGEARDANAVRSLLNLVDHHADPNARVAAIKALCKLDIEYIVELLIMNFQDTALSVKNAVLDGLTTMTRRKVVKPLLIYLFDRDKTISFWCEKTLKTLNIPALPSVFELLVTLDTHQHERFTRNLHQLKPEQLLALLNQPRLTLDDFDPDRMPEETVVTSTIADYRDIRDLLAQVKEQKGSDLHINIGLPPMIRIHGDLTRMNLPPISEEKSAQLLLPILNEEQTARFRERWEFDFSYEVKHVGRFRVNIFKQRAGISAVFRLIPTQIPTFEELGLDRRVFEGICDHRNGLILVTGPTGSGKSTTMAAMVDAINRTRYEHILTIEDPIEFVHLHKRCSINQRELGAHTQSFANALRSALREDPDVILVGEMRDPETIKLALTASETGHLVFSTLHTINTYESINRIIGAFPADHQDQVRLELAGVLRAIVSQKLMPRADHQGRVLAYEMLVCNTAVKNLIKEAKTEQIVSIMQTAQGDHMQTMDQSLAKLLLNGACSLETVLPHVTDKKSFNDLTQRQSKPAVPGTPAGAPPMRPPTKTGR